MLCRALLAAAALSYVLCVLLLSGVQKEDIDANTLRKLQRHNVNIDDINDQQLQKQCIGKTSVPEKLITTQANLGTERTKTAELITTKETPTEKDTEDMTQLQKIFQYLEYKRKKETLKDSKLTLGPVQYTTLSSSSPLRDQARNINVVDTSSKSLPRRTFDLDKDDEKPNKIRVNKELEDLINIWQANIDNISVKTGQETSTTNIYQEDPNLKSPKDIEYIAKIVEEIISKRQINEVNSTAEPKRKYNISNGIFREEDRTFEPKDAQSKNKTISATNYFLNNCNLGNFYAAKQGVGDKYDTLNTDKQLIKVNSPVRDDNYICKKFDSKEKKILTEQIHDKVIHNILSKLKMESHSFKQLDNKSATETTVETENTGSDLQNNHIKTKNHYNTGSNPLSKSIEAFKNLTRTFMSNRQSEPSQIKDALKEKLDPLDSESARALATALETQSNIFKQIFNQQRDLIKLTSIDKERLKLLENESRKELQAALIDEPPPLSYIPSNQDDGYVDKSYKRTRYTVLHPLNKPQQTIEPSENIVINRRIGYNDKENSAITHNNMQYDEDLGNESKRPWFYREVGNEQFRTNKKEIPNGSFFEPNHNKKITKNVKIEKKWSPYFDSMKKNAPIMRTDEHETPKNQQAIIVNSDRRKIPNRGISQKHANLVGLYQNNNEPPNSSKERSAEQFEVKRDKKINRFECQTAYVTRIECLSDWAYFRNKQNTKHKPDREEHIEKTEYFNYQFPSRPRITKEPLKDGDNKSRIEKYIDEADVYTQNQTKDSIKFSTNIINNIANSIKEIIFKDFTTTTTIPSPTTTTSPKTTTITTTMPSTTVSSPVTTTTTATTPKTTITTPSTTTIRPPEGTTTTEPLRIQDASKALEKIMKMFEQINLMKDRMGKHGGLKYAEDIPYATTTKETTQKTIIRHPEQPVQLNAENHPLLVGRAENSESYNPQALKFNPGNSVSYQQRPLMNAPESVPVKQPTVGNLLPYDPQTFQSNPENRTPYFPPAVHQRRKTSTPYFPPDVQMRVENRLSYEQRPVQSNSDNRPPYIPSVVQTVRQNAYTLAALQRTKENRTLYMPPVVQVNGLPYNAQPLQSYPENRPPRLPLIEEQMPGNRIPYLPLAVQIQEKDRLSYDPQTLKGNPENLSQYLPLAVQPKVEDRVPYDPQTLQRSPENSVPFSQQSLQNNLGMNAPYDTHPFPNNPGYRVPYDAQPLPSNPDNSLPFHSQPLPRVPYDPLPLQRDSKNRYDAKPSYYNSKIQLDPYSPKEVLQPIKQKTKPRKYAITVQTNSREIPPLQIPVEKPIVQTIVLTTKSPGRLEQHSDETYENKRSSKKPSPWRHHGDKTRESQHKDYYPRHTHKDAYIEHPKVRKFKKDHDNQQYKPRDFHEIERFHEKLEKDDSASQHEEEKIAKRLQRPIVKNTNYDDTHFRNFLNTQQKVNAMLERILATSKNKPISTEVI